MIFTCLQYYSDANDAESWMTEKMYVVSSEDYGRDEQSAMVGDTTLFFAKIKSWTDKIIYLVSDTQGVVSQSPEPRAHNKSVWQYKRKIN